MKRLLFIAPAVAFVLLLAGFFVGLGRDPSILPSQLIDKPLPAFSLPSVRPGAPGLEHTEFRGEPKLLNVFGSWCAACRIEHPFLMRLRAQGVPIHGLDWKDQPGEGAAWLDQFGDPYIRTGDDASGRTGIDLGVTGAPETFVVDGRGKVRYRHVGPITPQIWTDKIEPLMKKLRQES
jgi:cytochrome c biogenesis protein CcmG, thiol:disulfide interchange protein DsbE